MVPVGEVAREVPGDLFDRAIRQVDLDERPSENSLAAVSILSAPST